MKTTFWAAALLIGSVTTGCVTINIYFPAAAAEKAADKIIDDIWQLKQGAKSQPEAKGESK
jgi:hypothetical protein